MKPWLDDGDVRLYHGDALRVLEQLPSGSVDCIITSPPYYGLRDYGTGAWEGGDEACDHKPRADRDARELVRREGLPGKALTSWTERDGTTYGDGCGKCGATRRDEQYGLEATPDEHVAVMVRVFREARRVLADHGTLWLNYGDSYTANGSDWSRWQGGQTFKDRDNARPTGLPAKNLLGMPWRVAFALQADGWVLRSDIVWSKLNPMPESVTDRPTKAHEMVFLFAKAKRSKGIEPLPMREVDAVWLAAIVDGEGTICFQERDNTEWSPHIGIRLSIVNTNRALLERVAAITTLDANEPPQPRLRNGGGDARPIYTWQFTNAKAAAVIAAIRPYLIAKQRQADLALYVHDLNQRSRGKGQPRTTDAELAAKRRAAAACSALNHGDDPDLSWLPVPRIAAWTGCHAYAYDADAVREALLPQTLERGYTASKFANGRGRKAEANPDRNDKGEPWVIPTAGRNARSVWEIATQPTPEAHFATFPEELVRRCLLAGCPTQVCRVCGKPRERIVERQHYGSKGSVGDEAVVGMTRNRMGGQQFYDNEYQAPQTIGFTDCGHHAYRPGVTLDPFIGSATTALVARKHGRHATGIELNADYLSIAARRLQQLSLLAEEPA